MQEMIYSKKIVCPVCKHKFTSMKSMESKLRVEKVDTDFLTYYEGDNIPLKYNVTVCPKCGYSALDSNFNKINPRKANEIREKVTSKWKEQDFTGKRTIEEALICYKLSLYCSQVIGSKKVELAGICLRIAWMYRILGSEKENEFIKLSAKLYEESYTTEETNMDELTITYLIGELYRRIRDIEKATNWMGKVISSPYIKTNPKIENLARDQWQIIKDEKNENM